jgi:hypothetical protein
MRSSLEFDLTKERVSPWGEYLGKRQQEHDTTMRELSTRRTHRLPNPAAGGRSLYFRCFLQALLLDAGLAAKRYFTSAGPHRCPSIAADDDKGGGRPTRS